MELKKKLKKDNWKLSKYSDIKEHTSKQFMGWSRGLKGNQKKIRTEWKLKYNISKFVSWS